MAKKPIRLHIVSLLQHWREFYQPYQEWRLKLVHRLDNLDIAPNGVSLLLDGQALPLEDYLAVRPDKQEAMVELAQAGLLQIGPWYVLPDEFLVSPEALIRNLSAGIRIATQFGVRPNVGYMPMPSGHIGQLPQILRGFGIESAVVTRGLGDMPLEMWWEAPDGSRVLLSYLRDGDGRQWPYELDGFKNDLTDIGNRLEQHTHTGAVLLMEDQRYNADELIRATDRHLRGIEIIPSSLSAYMADVQARLGSLPVIKGELRSSQRFPISTGSLSARLWIKQRNHAVQMLLEHWAEPFSTWVNLLAETGQLTGSVDRLKDPDRIIEQAWRILFQNHACTTIGGNGTDPTQRETWVRFEHAEQIAAEIARQNLVCLASQVDTSEFDDKAKPIIVFNGIGHPHTDVAEVTLKLRPEQQPFEIIDAVGNSQPFSAEPASYEEEGILRVRFIARDVPAYGYRTYAIRPASGALVETTIDHELVIENELLSVNFNPADGTFTLFDKRTGRSFHGLNAYVDGGDRGDTYTFCPPQRDTIIDIATNTPIKVQRRISPIEQSLEFFHLFRLPTMLTPERDRRLPLAAQFGPLSISTTLRVARDIPRVDIEISLSNDAWDHRLRAHFPTGVQAHEALFDGHFEIVRRTLVLPDQDAIQDWAEVPGPDKPQRAFTTVMGDETGLTIANRGLPEVAVLADKQGAEIALTLLRSVGWLSRDDLPNRKGSAGPIIETPEAQCLGSHQLSYSVIPHGSDPRPAWRQAWAFQSPLWALITDRHQGRLGTTGSLVSSNNPNFVLSAVKTASDGKGLIVRGYSISSSTEQVKLQLGMSFSRAEFTCLDETPTGQQLRADTSGTYTIEIQPAQIVTLYFAV